jgi:hypothetical protein
MMLDEEAMVLGTALHVAVATRFLADAATDARADAATDVRAGATGA